MGVVEADDRAVVNESIENSKDAAAPDVSLRAVDENEVERGAGLPVVPRRSSGELREHDAVAIRGKA